MAAKSEKKGASGKKVLVRQIGGLSGRIESVRETLRCLGLGRIGKEREHVLNPAVEGMIHRVKHLVRVYEVK